ALAAVALSRGAFDEGLEGLAKSAAEYERLHVDALALHAYWQYAWHAHALGRHADVLAAWERVRRIEPTVHDSLGAKYARRTRALATLARMETGLLATNPATVGALNTQIGEESQAQGEWLRWRGFFDLLVRYRSKDWNGVVAAYRELETPTVPLAVTWEAGDALERLGRRP